MTLKFEHSITSILLICTWLCYKNLNVFAMTYICCTCMYSSRYILTLFILLYIFLTNVLRIRINQIVLYRQNMVSDYNDKIFENNLKKIEIFLLNSSLQIYNEGVGAVGSAELEIFWPVEVDPGEYEDGKHLLYLMQTEVWTHEGIIMNHYLFTIDSLFYPRTLFHDLTLLQDKILQNSQHLIRNLQ